ncbi:hypothetical protein EW145_g6072 [Phellinidium pouzarii]|uniref:Uncharacterized protein n=1 Tax=Phellinidium pouzarii TaxID=167371 RepID=A0A4S4KYE4_9AGAM|nr:hypothetical protein EW145_g6072 [Phellinidium pouzarii]
MSTGTRSTTAVSSGPVRSRASSPLSSLRCGRKTKGGTFSLSSSSSTLCNEDPSNPSDLSVIVLIKMLQSVIDEQAKDLTEHSLEDASETEGAAPPPNTPTLTRYVD